MSPFAPAPAAVAASSMSDRMRRSNGSYVSSREVHTSCLFVNMVLGSRLWWSPFSSVDYIVKSSGSYVRVASSGAVYIEMEDGTMHNKVSSLKICTYSKHHADT